MVTSQSPLVTPIANLEAQAVQGIEDAGQALDRLNDRAMAFVRERPVTCVLGAAAVGFVIGKLVSRS